MDLAASLGGGPLSVAASLLITRHFRFDAADPGWADRDRLAVAPELAELSATLAARLGIPATAFESAAPAVGVGAGAALAERLLAARFGRSLVDHRTWVMCGGQELASGPVQEAAWLAAAWRLGRLTVVAWVEEAGAPGLAGFTACGWAVRRTAANDPVAVGSALSAALRSQKPSLIVCVGELRPTQHSQTDMAPAWQAAGHRLAGARRAWLKRLARHAGRQDFEAAMAGRLFLGWHAALSDPGPLLPTGSAAISTAETLRHALGATAPLLPDLAVLPGDPAWPVPAAQTEPPAGANAAAGRLASGMNAVLAGVALHGGVVPITTQSVARFEAVLPGLRTLAASQRRGVQILVEAEAASPQAGQRAALRALRNLHVFRPCDAAEALECLELSLRRQNGPSVLMASELAVPLLTERPARTHAARGGYLAAEAAGPRAATLIASGPEVSLALRVRSRLSGYRLPVAVVSLPCWEMFAAQDEAWRTRLLGEAPRIGLEPGSGFGWERWLGTRGLFIPTNGIGEDQMEIVAEALRRHLSAAATI